MTDITIKMKVQGMDITQNLVLFTHVLLTYFVYSCTVNLFCVHLYSKMVLQTNLLQRNITLTDITNERNVQGTDITSEKNVQILYTQNQFTVHVYTGIIQGWNPINNK